MIGRPRWYMLLDPPSFWGWRERIAACFGPTFWPLWYIAPRRSRDRWERIGGGE